MSAKIYVQLMVCVLLGGTLPSSQGAEKAEKKSSQQLAQTGRVQSVAWGGFGLSSEKVREQLGLSEKQEREIAAIMVDSQKLWTDQAAKNLASRKKMGEDAMGLLTDKQRKQLGELKTLQASWFGWISNAKNLEALGLGKKAESQVREVVDAYIKERTTAFQTLAKPDPDAAKRAKEIQEKHRALLEEVKGEVRGILEDPKYDALLTEVARIQFQSIYQQQRYGKEIGLTGAQSKELTALVEERNRHAREIGTIKNAKERIEKWKEWRDESGKKAFGVLNADQKEKVKKLRPVESMWFSALSWPGVLDKLNLGDKNRKQLEESLEGYREKRKETFRPDPAMAARSRAIQEKHKAMLNSAQGKVREILTDAQMGNLMRKIAGAQITYLFRRPDVAKELELTEEQIGRLDELVKTGNQAMRDRVLEAAEKRRKLMEKAEGLLTPEQKEKLSGLSSRPTIRVNGGQK